MFGLPLLLITLTLTSMVRETLSICWEMIKGSSLNCLRLCFNSGCGLVRVGGLYRFGIKGEDVIYVKQGGLVLLVTWPWGEVLWTL